MRFAAAFLVGWAIGSAIVIVVSYFVFKRMDRK